MKRLKRGFSIAEAMVAMALIVLATTLAISISVMCTAQMNKTYNIFQSSNLAADSVTCYRIAYENYPDSVSAQSSSFRQNLAFYLGYASVTTTADEDDENIITYEFTLSSLDAKITINYTQNILSLYTYNSGSKNALYTFGYNIASNCEVEV